VTNVLFNHELRDSNSSAISALYRVLIRRPWKTWALTTWNEAKHVLQIAGFAAALVMLIPPAPAHAQTYHSVYADVPFEFTIGARTFSPGSYQLVFRGNGILVLRDSQTRILAALFTHDVTAKGPVVASKLIFSVKDGHHQLHQVWLENRSEGFEIIKEELAMRSPTPAPPPAVRLDVLSLFERRAAPGLKD
jgi:hypothetical protein